MVSEGFHPSGDIPHSRATDRQPMANAMQICPVGPYSGNHLTTYTLLVPANNNNHMTDQFAFSLRIARSRAGLTQEDCALLAGIAQSRISALERGAAAPSAAEFCRLSILLNRRFDDCYTAELDELRGSLPRRLDTVSGKRRFISATFNRDRTIERLRRLLKDSRMHHADD